MAVRSQLHTWKLTNQRVFLRADLNVPLNKGAILNDFKLTAELPTLDLLLKQNAAVILATHLGRPQGFDPALSTKPIAAWLTARGYRVTHVPFVPDNPCAQVAPQPGEITLLENLRFYAGEKNNDPLFAEQLAAVADYYVHDAFALMHRHDTSVALLPSLFAPDHRTVGLLVEREVAALAKLVFAPEKPFVLIVGGGKVADKLPLLAGMLDRVTHILLCPALVFTFLKAQGTAVGKSLVDDNQLEAVTKFMANARQRNVELIFPLDYQVASKSFDGPLSLVSADQFPADGVGMSIGPQTAALFAPVIHQAKTVFFNGLPGVAARPGTLTGAQAIFNAMTHSKGYTVIGGGDSVAAAEQLIDTTKISYCSTGGGATLTYLAEKDLPGLKLFV